MCLDTDRTYTASSPIRFSDWGAHQISLDFQHLRDWISSNRNIQEESRRYLLLIDSIRQCEGVAKVLQQVNNGEVVDVRPIKNKVSPLSGNLF